MKKYIGMKNIKAKLMTNVQFKCCTDPKFDEYNTIGDNVIEGYLVEYLDSPSDKFKHLGYDNYISWSPKDVFEKAYKLTQGLNIGFATQYLKNNLNSKIARLDWDNGVFVFLVPGSKFIVNRPPLNSFYKEGTEVTYHPHFDIMNKNGIALPWTPTQEDLYREDYYIVD